ncbi:NAD(P)-binding domain-containing protein [Sphingomonas sp. SUN019]|uniref:flavin-containing monooxygenase n=1 Tax=Sphingomonas sp. SUN019 TaxID=2937788 RepID=UPI002164319C|nr:NAD(P)-binding domain-containing protein [Sphingomonas sp. SUN019]UVO49986.1 NAD(P)-binding domain-containing protein [Sphingomonas sp. SUN019]
MGESKRACIIGAGCSGFTTAKRLKDEGISFDCFEMSDEIGGNWYYRNPNNRSACYQSLHIDTSKWRLAFEDYPVPAGWPDFPSHTQLFQYFKDYVAHFDLRPHITFNTAVETAARRAGGGWSVTLSTGETRDYETLFVCNGHHWDAKIPDYPGTFDNPHFHAHDYRDPYDPVDLRGKNVVVVGMGNSAMDIASELSQRHLAANLWVAARRGVWVLPKYAGGKPMDKSALPLWMPRKLGKALARRMVKKLVGRMEDYGLPAPDHEPLDAHPSVSGDFLNRAGSGDIKFKPNIKALEGTRVRFDDDSVEQVDAIIYATGYRINFPFFDDPALKPDKDNRFPLYKRMLIPGIDDLFFMGLAQPLPTLVNFAEQQSKLAAGFLSGRYALPSPDEMRRITAEDEKVELGDYYQSTRHTIQVDFARYVADLHKEVAKGERRAKAGVRKEAA